MYVDLWAWFRNYEITAIRNGDHTRRTLVTLAREGWRYREAADADNAIITFKEGVNRAETLNEPCWVLFHKYWVAEMMFYLKHDYQGTLDYIVRVTAEARKEMYEDCPVRSRIFFVLANIYYMIDFFSYEPQITELLAYIEDEVAMDEDTHMRLLHLRAQIDFDYDRFDESEERTQDMLNRTPYNAFRQRSGYHMLRAIAYAKGDIELALRYAFVAERYAAQIQIQRSIAEGKLWMAVYLMRLNDPDGAQKTYDVAVGYYEQYNLQREVAFHDASAEFLELKGEHDEALALRKGLIAHTRDSASIYNQMFAHWQYCRTLGRLGHDVSDALMEAKALSATMQNPTMYHKKLSAIESGNYYEFQWQAKA